MDDIVITPNSHKYKEEQKEAASEKRKARKVVKGPVKTKKKNEMSKISNAIFSEDAKNVKNFVLLDVVVPSFKKLISDIVTNAVDMLLFGGKQRDDRRGSAPRVSYRNYYDQRENDRPYRSSSSRSNSDYDDVILSSRGEAEYVLDSLNDIIEQYGRASVGDLYDLVGLVGDWSTNDYGWTNISSARVISTRDGWLLDMPRVVPIK